MFIYDGYPGGIGLSKRGFEAFESLAADTVRLIADCPCESGCPSCVQSPKCGNLNEPLSKGGAVRLLEAILEMPVGEAAASPLTLDPADAWAGADRLRGPPPPLCHLASRPEGPTRVVQSPTTVRW